MGKDSCYLCGTWRRPGDAKRLSSTACKKIIVTKLEKGDNSTGIFTSVIHFIGRDFEPGIIFLKQKNTSFKVNYVKRLLTSMWAKTQMPFYRSLFY